MFSKNKKSRVFSSIIILFSIAMITNAFFWQSFIIKQLNNQLLNNSYQITSAKISGNLFYQIKVSDVNVTHPIYGSMSINQGSINIDFISSLFFRLTFDDIIIENLKTESLNNRLSKTGSMRSFSDPSLPFDVDHFFINGQIPIEFQDSILVLIGEIEGKIKGQENIKLEISKLSLMNEGENSIEFKMSNLDLRANKEGIIIEKFSGRIGNAPINGEISYLRNEAKYIGSINIDKFFISKDLFSKTPLKGKFSEISGKVDFESIDGNINGNLSISNQLGLSMSGDINLINKDSNILLRSLNLYGEESKLRVNGVWEDNRRISGYFYLDSLDLSRWIIEQEPTLLSGMAILEGSIDQRKALENIELTLEVAEYGVFAKDESSFHGTVSYSDSIISTVDPVMLIIGESILSINGRTNLKTRQLDITADLENADIDIINRFWMDEFKSGSATGKLKIRGTIESPDAVADLNCNNIVYRDFSLNALSFHSEMESDLSVPSGFVNLKFEEGRWKNEQFDSGTLDISFSENRMVVENCHFKSGKDYLLISGSWLSKNKYKIDRLQSAYRENYLINAKPIYIIYKDTTVSIEPFEIHINDGILDGILTFGSVSEGRLKMSNFDAKVLTQFIDNRYLDLSGIIYGELGFSALDNFPSYDIDISLKKGKYLGESFDQMNISALLKSDVMHIDDISMTRDTSLGFQLSGILPLKKSTKGKSTVSLNTTYKDLPMAMVHKLIPNFYNIEGNATGTLKLFGSLDKTKFEFNTKVNEAVFDRIFLGDIVSKGSYNNNSLLIDYANSKNKEESISSYGRVPFDLNLGSKQFGEFFVNDSIDYHSTAALKSMPFLSPYIPELDSIKGDVNIVLSLSGLSNSIIRNGSIKVTNASIYTMLINNPLINVDGAAVVNNNKMKIEYLKGASLKYPIQNVDNIKVSGVIDFSSFFEPHYNLLVNSINKNNIYLNAIPIDLVGAVDFLDVAIAGKDTLFITGTIEAVEATLFHEFISEDIGTTLSSNDGITMSYSLNIPIKDEGKFQNSQVDATMVGEISVSKTGNEFWNIGGEIYINDGSILSFKDNFTGLNGYVTFDNNGINPNMDLMASTDIADEEIRLRITGDLDDADLILESSSGFSESDIIELLTFGSRFEDQELSSTGFGVQATSVLGSLLETQFEKNLEEMSALKILRPDEIDLSGTASFISGQNLSASERDELEDFKISAKKKFGSKTYANLSYKKSFSLTNPDQLQIGVEYKLNRNLSLVGNMDDKGNLHLKYRYRYAY
tara:strand:+ start:149 stop:3952 length:3804 start_codon:yes stop_codon:yes gene_type:complete